MDLLLTTAIRAAEAAARVHLTHFRKVGVEGAREKAQSDFVTQVDLEAQEAAVDVILRSYPDHEILAEEEMGGDEESEKTAGMVGGTAVGTAGTAAGTAGTVAGTAGTVAGTAGTVAGRGWPPDGGYLWIIDPLDGTTNYLHGHPMFAASVGVGRAQRGEGNPGLRFGGILEAGAVVAPRTRERWWGRRGEGAWKNGRPISVSGIRNLGKALIGTGFPFKEPEIVPRYAEQLQRVLPNTGGVRRGGAAALDLCYLAEGILDGFWEEDYLSPWDTAAGLLILSEAGGVASRLDGSAISLENGSILAGNCPEIMEGLGDLLMGPG
jgi:myo-inositol-1(or 4)-monophosphatase